MQGDSNRIVLPQTKANASTKTDTESPLVVDEELVQKKRRKLVLLGQLLIAVLFIALWELLTKWKIIDAYYWSSPSTIWKTGMIAWTDGTLGSDLLYTSGATILGFILGTVAGSMLGLSFWWSSYYSRISEPYLIAFNAVPKLALAPVLVILFGIGFSSKVILAFMMTVIVTALAAHSGVKSVDPDLEKMLFSLGAKRRHVFLKVVIPSAMPWIISSLKINIALALAGTIVGEFISSRQGIGRMILYAGQIMNINLVWVGVVVLSILSIVMYVGTVWIEKLLLKGHQTE